MPNAGFSMEGAAGEGQRLVGDALDTGGPGGKYPQDVVAKPHATIEFRCGPPCTEVVLEFSVRLLMNHGGVTMRVKTDECARVIFDGLGEGGAH